MRHFACLVIVSLLSFTAAAHTRTEPPPIHELALAQDAVAPDAGHELVASPNQMAITATAVDGSGLAGTLVVLFGAIIAITKLLRDVGQKLPGKVGEWFATPFATWLIPMVLSISGALVTTLTSGQPVTFMLIVGALLLGASGGGIGAAGAKEAQIKKADAAGELAAAGVTTKADTVSVFRKGPPA